MPTAYILPCQPTTAPTTDDLLLDLAIADCRLALAHRARRRGVEVEPLWLVLLRAAQHAAHDALFTA